MDVTNVRAEIEKSIKALSERMGQYNSHLNNEILPALEKLQKEKKAVKKDAETMNGAIQAYQQCLQQLATIKSDAGESCAA